MEREKNIILQFLRALEIHGTRPDTFFEFDAQPFSLEGSQLLFTTDEYSGEDHFDDGDPYLLGWNVAAATVCDILAAGGEPLFYGHGVTVSLNWDTNYIDQFSKGIASYLKSTGICFVGGDLGMADSWKYTGIALGKVLYQLSRKGALPGDQIYMTGTAGNGNVQAAFKLFTANSGIKRLNEGWKFTVSPRHAEAELIRKYANCCTDSSDGLFNALKNIADINKLGFSMADPPYCSTGIKLCEILKMPRCMLVLGECGEYELVFTVSPASENAMLQEAAEKGLDFIRIGTMMEKKSFYITDNGVITDLSTYGIYARDYNDAAEYLSAMINFLEYGKQE